MVKRAIGVVVVGSFVAAFIGLGIWQLGRWGDRRAFNDTLVARAELPIIDPAADRSPPDELAYRRARTTGAYDPAREIILLSRSYRGISGHHVVTPLLMGDGRVLLIDRGWVPLTSDDPPLAESLPPAGPVTVEGVLLPSQVRGRFGPRAIDDPPHRKVFRVDLDVLEGQFDEELVPLYLQLDAQQPPQPGELPVAQSIPSLHEGPHLAYAIQWFLFATTALVIAAAVVRRRAQSASRGAKATATQTIPGSQ